MAIWFASMSPTGCLDLVVDQEELGRRRATLGSACSDRRPRISAGCTSDHVLQANEGCDLDFLRGKAAVVKDAVTYL